MGESAQNARAAFLLASAAAVCFLYFVLALLTLHVFRPDYTVIDHMISDYAVGRFGWIMTTAFVSAALGFGMLGVGIFKAGPSSWLGRLGAGLLLVASVGLSVTAVFPTDLETAPSTRTGDIHALSFLVNIFSVLFAALLLGFSYGTGEPWRRHRPIALGFAALLLVAFLAQFFSLHRGAPYGLTNRAFVIVLMAWAITTCLWLRRVAISRV